MLQIAFDRFVTLWRNDSFSNTKHYGGAFCSFKAS
jgi:hypothetical protein